MTTSLLVDVLGWIGAIAVLTGYLLVSTRGVRGDTYPYQTLNLLGSICLVANTVFYGAYPSTFVNIIWGAIAVYTILLVWRRRTAAHGST